MSRRVRVGGLFLGVAIMAAACGGGSERTAEAPGVSEGAAALPEAPKGEGTITGRIKFEGKAPTRQVVRMGSDPMCMVEGEAALSEVLIVGPDNGLQNVFVHVKDAFNGQTFRPPSEPVVLDQKGCKYLPHIFGVQVGQPVRIVNSDPTLHNVHALPKANTEFNFGQTPNVPPATRTFDKPEIMVAFRCDVHGWMNAHAGVVPHPFFAISKADGTFEIKGLPAGSYTIEAWHERLGTQTMTVTSDGKMPATADFAFKQAAS